VRQINFTNSTAIIAQQSWTVDKDCLLSQVEVMTAGAVVSCDPTLTVANTVTTPLASGWDDGFRVAVSTSFQLIALNFLLAKGTKIFCAFAASKGFVTLYLEDIPAE